MRQRIILCLFFCIVLSALICAQDQGRLEIRSGRVNTQGKFSFQYGKTEVKIKLPRTSAGLWLMGADYGELSWSGCGEIDVMEMGRAEGSSRGTAESFLSAGCHWGILLPRGGHPNYCVNREYPQNLTDEFHRFILVWDSGFIRMYLDDDPVPYYEMRIDIPGNDYPPSDYFHKFFFVLFNLAAGGGFTGIYDPSAISTLNQSNNFSASMYVNYLRVYDSGGALFWRDEFESLDENKWNIEVRDDGGGNHELQTYCRENVSVGLELVSGESCLILTAKAE